MTFKHRFAASAALACLGFTSFVAAADDHVYTEGQVVNVSAIRTVDGKLDEYMKYVDTTWKQEQEAAKKAGYIVSYQVLQVAPRTENDADLYLVITYKDWAALDGALAKGDAISKQVEGSVAATNQGVLDRNKIRRLIGSANMQVLNLK